MQYLSIYAFTDKFRRAFEEGISAKTGWGKNEVMNLFDRLMSQSLAAQLDEQNQSTIGSHFVELVDDPNEAIKPAPEGTSKGYGYTGEDGTDNAKAPGPCAQCD